MAKQGMKRPERTHTQPKNRVAPVPELQGKAKHEKKNVNPIVSGSGGTEERAHHREKPATPRVYPVIDTDLARDNLQNDLPAADLSEL